VLQPQCGLSPYIVQNDVLTAGAPEPDTVLGTPRNHGRYAQVIHQCRTGADGNQQLHYGVCGWVDDIEFNEYPFGSRIARPTGNRLSARVHDPDAFVDQIANVSAPVHVRSPLVTAVRLVVVIVFIFVFVDQAWLPRLA
jgi:hypothetical protein